MNDIKRLLAEALNEESTPMTVDPSEDVARGHRHLVRRRTALVSGLAAAALLVGGGGVLIASSLPSDDTSTRTNPAVLSQTGAPVAEDSLGPAQTGTQQVTLVAYTGKQPKGYRVKQIPDGWAIQGGTESSLTIAPRDAADKDPNSFVDKLTVLSASSDTPKESLTEGDEVPVGSGTGYYRIAEGGGDVQVLTFQDRSSGRWVQIQVPAQLHWDATRIGEFAAGVTVVGGAGDSHG